MAAAIARSTWSRKRRRLARPGQTVVAREIGDARLGVGLLGDVLDRAGDPGAVLGPVRSHFALGVDVAHRSVRQHHAMVDAKAVLAAHPVAHLAAHPIAIGRMHGREEALPGDDRRSGSTPEDADTSRRTTEAPRCTGSTPSSRRARCAGRATTSAGSGPARRARASRAADSGCGARAARRAAAWRRSRWRRRHRRDRATRGSPSAVTTRMGVGSLRVAVADRAAHREAVGIGHVQIEEDQARAQPLVGGERLDAVRHFGYREALDLQRVAQHRAHQAVVVDDQDQRCSLRLRGRGIHDALRQETRRCVSARVGRA